jgi:hypothetical protein
LREVVAAIQTPTQEQLVGLEAVGLGVILGWVAGSQVGLLLQVGRETQVVMEL